MILGNSNKKVFQNCFLPIKKLKVLQLKLIVPLFRCLSIIPDDSLQFVVASVVDNKKLLKKNQLTIYSLKWQFNCTKPYLLNFLLLLVTDEFEQKYYW